MRQWLVCEINVISKIWQHNSAKINISGGACNITKNLVYITKATPSNTAALLQAHQLSPPLPCFCSACLLSPLSPPCCLACTLTKQLKAVKEKSCLLLHSSER